MTPREFWRTYYHSVKEEFEYSSQEDLTVKKDEIVKELGTRLGCKRHEYPAVINEPSVVVKASEGTAILEGRIRPCPSCLTALIVAEPYSRACFADFQGNRPLAKEIARCADFALQPKGFLHIYGPVGVGKTHLVAAIVKAVYRPGTVYMNGLELHRSFIASRAFAQLKDEDNPWMCEELLVLDDIRPLSPPADFETFWHELVDFRYVNRKPTILCTNLSPADFWATLGEQATDRIHGQLFASINLTGKSRRSKRNPF